MFFHDVKKNLWFFFLCLSYSVHTCAEFTFFPSKLMTITGSKDFTVIFYLVSYTLVVLCMNEFAGTTLGTQNTRKYINFYNVIIGFFAFVSLFAPANYYLTIYYILSVFAIATCLYGVGVCLFAVREDEKIVLLPAIIVGIASLFTLCDIFFVIFNVNIVSFRCIYLPLILLSHVIFLTMRYRKSLKKTQMLSASLQNTLDRIQHSDNALMCTQMKADFLYRTLDLISQKCDEDPFDAEDLTISLSKYLRHTLNFQQLTGVVPFSNEIELTKAYIAIEKQRHPYITFEYNFPNPLPDFHIPPLTIQPIVENAIEHGLAGKMQDAKLTITIMPYKEAFHIDISDNGNGMEEELATSLTEILHDSARVGLYNINARLIDLFGKGLVIQSAVGVGTSISFVVPPKARFITSEGESK